MRTKIAVIVCTVTLLVSGAALAQECDFNLVGASMERAAAQGEWDVAYTHAALIVAAQPEDLATVSAQERYFIGLAHLYLMAEAFEAAGDELEGERAEFADKMRRMVLSPDVELVRTVGFGERIDIAQHLTPGKTVVVDFYSEYCPPCVAIAPHLQRLAEQRDDIVVLKVDINRPGVQGIDWSSPVAQQYEIRGVPYFRVYGPDGELVADAQAARGMVVGWIAELEE